MVGTRDRTGGVVSLRVDRCRLAAGAKELISRGEVKRVDTAQKSAHPHVQCRPIVAW